MIRDYLRIFGPCPDDGQLRWALEKYPSGEVPFAGHLASCGRCARRMEELRRSADEAGELLARIEPEQEFVSADAAYQRFQQRSVQRLTTGSVFDNGGGFSMAGFFQRRGARAGGVVLALLVVTMLVAVSPMGSVASNFLDRFRVTRFAAVTVDMDSLQSFQTDMMVRLATSDTDALQSDIQDLGSFDTTFDKNNPMANAQELDSAAEARSAFGDFKQPESLPEGFNNTPRIYMGEAGTASATIDTAKAQSIVDELGLPIYSLPDPQVSPEMTFTMDIPQSLVLRYENGDRQLVVGQAASPVLQTPEGINMDQLREDVLQLPGLPTNLVAQLRSIQNWEETLVIPVPPKWSSDDVTVQGQPGLLLTADDGSKSAVLWEDGGILYVVGGTESGDTVRDVANSLS